MAISQADWITLFKAGCDLLGRSLIDYGREGLGSENVVALVNAIKTAAKADYSSEQQDAAAQFRADYADLVGPARIRAILNPIFSAFLQDLATNKRGFNNPEQNWNEIYDSFIDRALYVTSRGITYDSSATASGTGNSTIYRMTEDHTGEPLEGGYYPCDTTIKCVIDEGDGAQPGAETYRIFADAMFDVLDQGLGGSRNPATNIISQNQDNLLSDGSFGALGADDDMSGSNPTLGGSWVDSAGVVSDTHYAIGSSSPAPYLASVEEVRGNYSGRLEIKTARTIQQQINRPGQRFVPTPWAVRFYRPTATTAISITVHWGSKSQTYDQTDLTADTWVTITPDFDKDLYPYQWQDADMLFKIEISSITGGSIFVDNCVMAPMIPFNGVYHWILPGTTQALAGASPRQFIFEDTVSSDTVIQRLIGIGYGRYLPSNTATTEITDP